MNDRNKFIAEQAERFKDTGFNENDLLSEVLQEMSGSDRREIRSRACVILCHLLKAKVQPEKICKSWINSIYNNRDEINYIFDESPSLKNFYKEEHIVKDWKSVLRTVSFETGINVKKLPQEPIFTVDDILNLSIDDLK